MQFFCCCCSRPILFVGPFQDMLLFALLCAARPGDGTKFSHGFLMSESRFFFQDPSILDSLSRRQCGVLSLMGLMAFLVRIGPEGVMWLFVCEDEFFFCVSFTTLLEIVLRGSLRNRMLEKKIVLGRRKRGMMQFLFYFVLWCAY